MNLKMLKEKIETICPFLYYSLQTDKEHWWVIKDSSNGAVRYMVDEHMIYFPLGFCYTSTDKISSANAEGEMSFDWSDSIKISIRSADKKILEQIMTTNKMYKKLLIDAKKKSIDKDFK